MDFIKTWEMDTEYTKSDIVLYEEKLYCVTFFHKSSSDNPPDKSIVYYCHLKDQVADIIMKGGALRRVTRSISTPKTTRSSIKKQVVKKTRSELEYDKIIKYRQETNKETLKDQILTLNVPIDLKNKIYEIYEQQPSEKMWLENACILLSNKNASIVDSFNSKREKQGLLIDLKEILDENIYGLPTVKERLLGHVAKCLTYGTAGNGRGCVLGLQGIAGVGKTVLLKCLEKGLKLPFFQINCGSISDSSILIGYSKTYKDAMYGMIADIMIRSKCNNPIIYLDEVDKIFDKSNVTGVLIHMLDPEQNMHFQDLYFQNIPIDLSNVTFVLSFNTLENINPILRDRLNIIKIPAPNKNEKFYIVKEKVLPKILDNLGLKMNCKNCDVMLDDQILKEIINLSPDSTGVRSIKHHLELILNDVNMKKIMNREKCITITRETLQYLLLQEKDTPIYEMMYI